MRELEGQAEELGFDSKCLGKPLGAFKGGSDRVRGASVKSSCCQEANVLEVRECSSWRHMSFCLFLREMHRLANKTVTCHLVFYSWKDIQYE